MQSNNVDDIYLSYEWLQNNGINENTINKWNQRRQVVIKKVGINAFVSYDSIPAPTRAKLPSKEAIIQAREREKDEGTINEFYDRLLYAKENKYPIYRDNYLNRGLSLEKILDYSKKHAVLEEVLTIRDEHKENKFRFPLRYVWQAFCKVYPDWYVYEAFSLSLKICVNEGIERLLMKKYVPAVKKFDARYEKIILDCMSSQKRYNQPQVYKKICKICDTNGWEKPSLSWTKQTFKRLEIITHSVRNGSDDFFYKQKPYMGIIKAQNANSQWQIDGWELPFYMEDPTGKGRNYYKLVLFWVIDACTSKVVGSYVSESENTETILKGLEDAITSTKVLPFEIVSDNHSFNKTKEAEYLKDAIARIGCTWTVSQNPRRKSIVERSFRTFGDDFCKDEYGYTGQGVKTKMKNGRPTQEMIDKAVKRPLTREQIILIAGRCIKLYNETKGRDGKSPNERYEEAVNDISREKKSFSVSELDIIQLFVRRSEIKVSNGQIAIVRSNTKYEFEISADQFVRLNNKTFGIRYVTFDEIMLFDLKTDAYIATVQRKKYAHGALADQTEEDKNLMFKHKGRLNGIDNAVKTAQENIHKEAARIDPEAVYVANPMNTPKGTFDEYRIDSELNNYATRHGVRLQDVPNIPVYCETNSIEPEDKKRKKKAEAPFHTEEKIDLSRFDY